MSLSSLAYSGTNNTLPLQTGDDLLKEINQRITNISTETLKQRLRNEPNLLLIDVRTRREIDLMGGYINAHQNINIPRSWIEHRIGEFATQKDQPIVVYCGTNARSPFVADTLTKMGYTHVVNYADAFSDWQKKELPIYSYDFDHETVLFQKPIKVIDNVWSAIGALARGTYENSNHNNNLSFIVTPKGVIVMNAGGSYLIAEALHDEIKKITQQPVKYVVLENAQGHAILGSRYWKEQGATIIAHENAAKEIALKQTLGLKQFIRRYREKAYKTTLVMPDKTFSDTLDLSLGGVSIKAKYLGAAHGDSDILLWLPKKKLVITGDLAFNQRLLPIFKETNVNEWINNWSKLEALKATTVIPGHGDPTTMADVRRYTYDYLVYLRNQIAGIIDAGGDMNDAYTIDLSNYQHLHTFRALSKANISRLFQTMEFE